MHICNNSRVLQVIGTAVLLLCVLALGDQRNGSLPDGLQPVLVGGAVLAIGVSMGSNSGYAINPARDIGPRLFTYIAGWGVDVFKLVVSVFKTYNLHFVAPPSHHTTPHHHMNMNQMESLIACNPTVFAGLEVLGGGCP